VYEGKQQKGHETGPKVGKNGSPGERKTNKKRAIFLAHFNIRAPKPTWR
jgi:hypothetical protein